jgi:uracil-DNA glycosylase
MFSPFGAQTPEEAGANCSACPLRARPKVRAIGTTQAPKLVIVLDQPSYHDEKRGELGVGPSGVMLNDLLYHAGLKRSDVFVTSAVMCRMQVPGETGAKQFDPKVYMAWLRLENTKRRAAGEPPIASPVDCCQLRLFSTLAHFENEACAAGQPNGAVVVTMGPVALKAVADKDGVLTWRGSPLPIDHFNPENT